MKHFFENIAKSVQFVRVQSNINQSVAAEESGISLRTLQNIESGKPVNSESLFRYLEYLHLLKPMLEVLPDPNQLTPMELLQSAPKRRERARMTKHSKKTNEQIAKQKPDDFKWGDNH